MRWRILLFTIFSLFYFSAPAQTDTVYLNNPSFEDMPRHSRPPVGWIDCGFESETPPDVQPSGTFSVTKGAIDGETYLGMVVRDNDTWESVSQRLQSPLQKGQCYEFSLHLARSELYISVSRTTNKPVNYVTPAQLRIYGGFDNCDKQYLLAESPEISNTTWKNYTFKLKPLANYTHLVLEVFYKTPTLFPYNGNILIDDASSLNPIPCQEEVVAVQEPQVEVQEPPQPEPEVVEAPREPARAQPAENNANRQPDSPETKKAPEVASQEEQKEEQKSFAELKRSDLKTGQIIRIDKLFFKADKSVITESSFEVLNEVFQFLDDNEDVIVEIGGHTNDLPPPFYCDKLSKERAKAVVEYLKEKGINENRLQYKGYGKRRPIATNETEAGRKRNQRVEIKILGFNG